MATTFSGIVEYPLGKGVLASTIDDNDMALPLQTGQGTQFSGATFPLMVTIDLEHIIIEAVVTDSLTVTTRGANSTVARAHLAGASVEANLMATHITEVQVAINAAETFLDGVAAGVYNFVVGGDLAVNGGDITSDDPTFNLLNSVVTKINMGGAAAVDISNAGLATTVKGSLNVDQATTLDSTLQVGVSGTTQGQASIVKGSGTTPGCIKLASANDTARYVFLENAGARLKLHTAAPTANTDGNFLQVARADLAQDDLVPYTIDLTTLRRYSDVTLTLPTTASSGTPGNLGLYAGVIGTAAHKVATEDVKNLGAIQRDCVFAFVVPPEYVAGQTIQIQINGGMITTVASVAATVDPRCYRKAAPSTALISPEAKSINSLTPADLYWTITPTNVVPGDTLYVLIITNVNDSATGTDVIAAIYDIRLLLDIKG